MEIRMCCELGFWVAVGEAAEECDVIRIFQDQNRSQKSISEFEEPSDAVRHAHVGEKVG